MIITTRKATVRAKKAGYSISSGTLLAIKGYDQSGGQTEAWVKNILTCHADAHYPPEYAFGLGVAGANEETEGQKDRSPVAQSLSVSPNPAKNFVNFRLEQSVEKTTSSLEIVDINGQVLQSYADITGDQRITWHTKGFASGIYFYRLLSSDGKVESGKIILTK